ncbi:MAG: hypothetical protein ACUVS2_03450 [Candidatus Flexifilum sp.]
MKTYSHRLYEMDWIVEGRVTYWKYWGDYTHDDLVAWDADAVDMLEHLPDDVVFCHAIYDMTEIRKMAPLRDYLALEARKHPKVGWTLIIGSLGPVQRFILSAATQAMQVRTRFVASLDEAIELLRSVDATLAALDSEQARAVAAAVDARTAAQRASV